MCELFLFCCANCFFVSLCFFSLLRTLGVHLSGGPTESASSHLIFGTISLSLAPLSFFLWHLSIFFLWHLLFLGRGTSICFFSHLFFSPLAPLLSFFLLWQLFSIERTSALSSCRSCTQHCTDSCPCRPPSLKEPLLSTLSSGAESWMA